MQSLDALMLNQWSLDPDALADVLHQMEEDRTRAPNTVEEILFALRQLAPTFSDAVRDAIAPWQRLKRKQ